MSFLGYLPCLQSHMAADGQWIYLCMILCLSALDWVTQRDRLVNWNSDISRFLGLPRLCKSQTRCQGESPSTMGQNTNTLHAKEGEGSILSFPLIAIFIHAKSLSIKTAIQLKTTEKLLPGKYCYI